MQEIERFFSNLFNSIVSRIRFTVTDAAERKIRETVDQQFDRRQRTQQNDQEDREQKGR